MATLDSETAISNFEDIVEFLHSKMRITGKKGDAAKEQFEQFLSKIVAVNKQKFLDFDKKVTRLD